MTRRWRRNWAQARTASLRNRRDSCTRWAEAANSASSSLPPGALRTSATSSASKVTDSAWVRAVSASARSVPELSSSAAVRASRAASATTIAPAGSRTPLVASSRAPEDRRSSWASSDSRDVSIRLCRASSRPAVIDKYRPNNAIATTAATTHHQLMSPPRCVGCAQRRDARRTSPRLVLGDLHEPFRRPPAHSRRRPVRRR